MEASTHSRAREGSRTHISSLIMTPSARRSFVTNAAPMVESCLGVV